MPEFANIPFRVPELLEHGSSFYIYRIAGTESIEYGVGHSVPGLHEGGFVVAPFDLENGIVETILSGSSTITSGPCVEKQKRSPFPSVSTPREFHSEGVDSISSYHRRHGGKTVLSRVILFDFSEFSLENVFYDLSVACPEATVFCFFTPYSGCWIGATPEKLLSCHDGIFSTMALAGTRPAGTEEEWDKKNQEEQQLVTDFIMEALAPFSPSAGKRVTRLAGPVEHLCTPVTAQADPTIDLMPLLRVLSPTPALCGSDRHLSMQLIRKWEMHSRGHYGGFFGPLRNSADFDFFVNLRSIRVESGRAALFVGGGITQMSDPTDEWLETERKAYSILRVMNR